MDVIDMNKIEYKFHNVNEKDQADIRRIFSDYFENLDFSEFSPYLDLLGFLEEKFDEFFSNVYLNIKARFHYIHSYIIVINIRFPDTN